MCPADCPCKTLTFIEVVPYREEESCPTDEALIYAWWQYKCHSCLTWWAERVMIDDRYSAIVKKLQYQWPKVAVPTLLSAVIIDFIEKPANRHNVPGLFHTILYRKAYKASGNKNKPQELQAEESMDFAKILEVPTIPAADPRLAFLIDCLKQLSEKERGLTQTVYYQGTSLTELAKTFHKSYAALAKQLSRIRAKLRVCIASKA